MLIQIGPFAILLKWILLGAAIVIGLVYIKWWMRHSESNKMNKKVYDLLFNSLILGFFIWKGSLVVLEPSLMMKSPFSLLYFTGGRSGIVLAIIGSIIFFFFKAKKLNISHLFVLQSVFLFSCAVLCGYHILALLFIHLNNISHIFLSLFTMIILCISLIKPKVLSQKGIFTSLILFFFLNLILSIAFGKIGEKIFIFSLEQWFYFCSIIVSLRYWDKTSVY